MAASTDSLTERDVDSSDLLKRYRQIRNDSRRLIEPLSPEDACVQSMPDASPSKWHLAHVTWFFETFILESNMSGFQAYDEAYRVLFNSYYNGVGEQYPRPRRGMITRPGLAEVLQYRDAIDSKMESVIVGASPEVAGLIELGLHHEQQHQELLLMDIKHLLSHNPLYPAYCERVVETARRKSEHSWHQFSERLAEVGADGNQFHFDNEGPRHRTWLDAFELGSSLVTNGDYLEFINDAGYQSPLLWLADGWGAVNDNQWRAPLYWRKIEGQWFEFTLHGLEPLDLDQPVCHVSHFEADAFAQWAGARLPTEFEWEVAAQNETVQPSFRFHPGANLTGSPAQQGLNGLFGECWQWTRSAYLPYPGFSAAAGAVGEYNGKFMNSQMVLRGSACITPPNHARATYRNFFYPEQRWAFSGLRLARDT